MKNLIGLVIFLLLTGFQAPFAVAWTAGAGQSQTNTLVHTQDDQGQASLKPIAQLQVGGKVLAKSEWKAQGESLSYEPITDIVVTPAQLRKLVDLVLVDEQKISTTDGHPFNTPEGWRDAILLKKGGKLLLKGDGESEKTVEIASVTHRTELQTTYNLEVANAHTFFVGEDGVLVHNGGRRPASSLRREWEEIYGCSWPKLPCGGNYHAHHIVPLADGGLDHGCNIMPLTPDDHRDHHKEQGDLRRWGGKRK